MRMLYSTAIFFLFVATVSATPHFNHLSKPQQKEVRCLAHNIYFEARSDSLEGKIAVANVTMNRVYSNLFPNTVCEVVRQRRNNVCQFSWWCSDVLRNRSINNRLPEKEIYSKIKKLSIDILTSRKYKDITEGALFYHANYIGRHRLGSMKLVHTTTVGQHIFYRLSK